MEIPPDLVSERADALEDFVARKEHLRVTTPLRYLFWEATLRCNLLCRHCGSDCLRLDCSEEDEIDAANIMRELERVAAAYPARECTFAIIGGEPLVRNDIIEVGRHAARLGFPWGITTNGTLLNAEMAARLKEAGLTTISVSLDGTREDHDTLRNRQGCYDLATKAIAVLTADPFYRRFDVICCVSRINLRHLAPFVDELAALGVPAVRFTPVFSRGRAGRNVDLKLRNDEYRMLLRFIVEQRSSRNDIKVSLSEEGYWGPEWECAVRDSFHYCSSGILTGTILHDGRVTGCPSVSRAFIEGDIHERPFVEIWRDEFRRYREGRKGAFAHQCAGCEHWILCEGGGFHLLDQELDRSACCLGLLT